MGTWSNGPFDNDDAAELMIELENAPSWDTLRSVFDDVLAAEDYLEAPEGARAVAAAALITVATGKGDVSAQDIHMILDDLGAVPEDLPELARQALKRVTTGDSEIRELYLDSGGYVEWLETVTAIETML